MVKDGSRNPVSVDFIPERATDFVFAVLAKSLDYLEYCFVSHLPLYRISRAYDGQSITREIRRLLAGSLVLTFFIYVFVNIGMVSGLLPVVGLPLPLLSYGGTSLVTMMAAFGILMAMYSHRRLLSN